MHVVSLKGWGYPFRTYNFDGFVLFKFRYRPRFLMCTDPRATLSASSNWR